MAGTPSANKISELLADVASGMDGLSKAVAAVSFGQQETFNKYAELSTRVEVMTERLSGLVGDMEHVMEIVRDGNGQPSLVQRITHAEADLTNVKQNGQPFIVERLARLESGLENLAENLGRVASDANQLRTLVDGVASAKVLSRGQIVAGVLGVIITAGLAIWQVVASFLASR